MYWKQSKSLGRIFPHYSAILPCPNLCYKAMKAWLPRGHKSSTGRDVFHGKRTLGISREANAYAKFSTENDGLRCSHGSYPFLCSYNLPDIRLLMKLNAFLSVRQPGQEKVADTKGRSRARSSLDALATGQAIIAISFFVCVSLNE